MTIERATVNGSPLGITFSENIIEQLGLKCGDELEITVIDKTLVIQTNGEAKRAKKFQEATDKIFTEYEDVFKALAAGAS